MHREYRHGAERQTDDKDDLIGQAYFVRAFAHFTLCRIFGGMPYLDKALEADDEWDMTRLSAWETYTRCAGTSTALHDYLLAAGKVRRDAARPKATSPAATWPIRTASPPRR